MKERSRDHQNEKTNRRVDVTDAERERKTFTLKERHNDVTKYKTAEIAKKEREANKGSIG